MACPFVSVLSPFSEMPLPMTPSLQRVTSVLCRLLTWERFVAKACPWLLPWSTPSSLWSGWLGILLCEYLLYSLKCSLYLYSVIAKKRHGCFFKNIYIIMPYACFCSWKPGGLESEFSPRMIFNLVLKGSRVPPSPLCIVFQKRYAGFRSYCDLEVLQV